MAEQAFSNQKVRLILDDEKVLSSTLEQHGAELADGPGPDVIHVFDKFEGILFQELVSRGWAIVSTLCVTESILLKKPLPVSASPIFSRILEGVTLFFALGQHSTAHYWTLADRLSATVVTEFSPLVDYLIANNTTSFEYRAASLLGCRIVQTGWLASCWKTRSLAPVEDFLLLPLSGCILSVTGLTSTTRQKLEALIKANGRLVFSLYFL